MTPPEDQDAAEATRARRGGPLAVLCLSAFGLGLSPIVPGTVASLATAALLLWMPTGAVAFVGLWIVLLVFGTWATFAFVDAIPPEDGEKHGDPGWVVSDEVAGQAIASAPTLFWLGDWRLALVALVAFRVFDMTKVGPVGRAEKLPGAKGVWLDDVVAGVLAASVTLAVGLTGVLP